MSKKAQAKQIEILLVEDNQGDVRLTIEALKEGKVANELHVARDGVEALDYLYKRKPYEDAKRPDLILLDLNLPRKDGREVLTEIKSDASLRRIPVVVLTTSSAEEDIVEAYNKHSNSYITKPVELNDFIDVVQNIGKFWLSVVELPES